MTDRDDQAAEELRSVNLLLANATDVPIGELARLDPPAPDFLLTTKDDQIGIEVTRVFRNEDAPEFEFHHQEKLREQVHKQAQEDFERRTGHVGVYVNVSWSPWAKLSNRTALPLGPSVARAVEKALPAIDGDAELEWDDLPEELQDHIGSICIRRYPPEAGSHWYSVPARWERPDAPDIEVAVKRKEAKLVGYREHCGECWLLLEAGGKGVASFLSDARNVSRMRIETVFDRVYLANLFAGGQVYRLA